MRCSPCCQGRNITQPIINSMTGLRYEREQQRGALWYWRFVLLGSDASLYRVTRQDWCWGRSLGRRAPPFLCIKLGSNDDHLRPVEYGLPSLFSLKLRFAMRLPQGLRPVPHCQHNAETYDRTDHSKYQAIICMLGIHFLPPFPLLASYSVHRPDQTTD